VTISNPSLQLYQSLTSSAVSGNQYICGVAMVFLNNSSSLLTADLLLASGTAPLSCDVTVDGCSACMVSSLTTTVQRSLVTSILQDLSQPWFDFSSTLEICFSLTSSLAIMSLLVT